uniref:Uncharacterized protein n=1 Tax=Panagrolaimus sp. PS1159 TaxID=55785 RepID=A0AC35EY41_9BILA
MADTASPTVSTVAAAAPEPSVSTSVAKNNNNAKQSVDYSRSTTGKGTRSGGKSTDRRRRRKKPQKKPQDFEVWPPEDKEDHAEVNKLMKLWKATQRQCLPVISNVGKFASMKQKIKPDDQYKQELKQYEESIKQIPKIGPDETFDFEDLVMRRREKAEAAAAEATSPTTPAATTPGN